MSEIIEEILVSIQVHDAVPLRLCTGLPDCKKYILK